MLDKAYYPVYLTQDGRWATRRITDALIRAASITPNIHQIREFEKSPAYANMIFNVGRGLQDSMPPQQHWRMPQHTVPLV